MPKKVDIPKEIALIIKNSCFVLDELNGRVGNDMKRQKR